VAALRYVVADVFTDVPLTGNQLAVFTDGRDVDDDTMHRLAREMNFSEARHRSCDVPHQRPLERRH
jgi:predicted PhzF superfamily epimerase YddE/YHI9